MFQFWDISILFLLTLLTGVALELICFRNKRKIAGFRETAALLLLILLYYAIMLLWP